VFSGGFGAVGVEDLGLPAISGGAGWLLSVWRSWVVAERRLELSAIWFPASRAFGDLVPGELGGRQVLWWLSAGSVHSWERSRRSVVVSGGSVQAWSISGVLWCYRRDWLSAILGLLVDSVVAVGDLGLSEGSGVAVGDLGCRQVLGWLLEFFLVADCWCYEGSGVADCLGVGKFPACRVPTACRPSADRNRPSPTIHRTEGEMKFLFSKIFGRKAEGISGKSVFDRHRPTSTDFQNDAVLYIC
jgi:hypothetical protein